MTWARYDDGWTDRPVFESLGYEVRWHYVCCVQWCCRTGRYDGLLRASDARRCSDVPDPAAALAELVGAGLLVEDTGGYRVVEIEQHALPAHLRDENREACAARPEATAARPSRVRHA